MSLNYKVILLLLFVVMRVDAADSLRTETIYGEQMVIHQVEKGETLYSLSRRYGAEIGEITRYNQIVNNTLSLDQLLRIPIMKTENEVPKIRGEEGSVHVVKTGETLFSISRLYGLKVYELREMNNLTGNEISIGQQLNILKRGSAGQPEPVAVETTAAGSGEVNEIITEAPELVTAPKKVEVEENFIEHQVQTGEELESIARRYGVGVDSLIFWNGLTSDYLVIGQKLKLKNNPELARSEVKLENTPYGTKKRIIDHSGFTRIVEEGLAMKIEEVIDTDKYLCLHRVLPVGSLVEIRNLMNNQKVFVKVVGKLPDTGLNEQVLIRLTPVAFKRLGIIDPRARVEISYYED